MNTFWIFRTELRRLLRSRLGIAAMVVGILIPLLYSGLYLRAFWDPYSQMEDYPVALVNLDQGGDKDGKHVDYGKELVDQLVKDHKVGWQVVSEEQANAVLESGEGFYLKVTIPPTFTADALSVTGDNPKRAEVQFTQNEGKNYIASTITKRLESSLREEVGNKFSKEYFSGIFDVIGDAGNGLSQAAEGANKLADGATEVHDGTVKAADASHQLADGSAKVADGTQQLTAKLQEANGGAVKLKDGATTIQTKLGEVVGGTSQVAANLTKTTDGVNQLHDKLATSVGKTGELQSGLTKLQSGLTQAQGVLGQFDAKGQPIPAGTNDPAKMPVADMLAVLAQKYNMASDPLYAGILQKVGGVSSNLGVVSSNIGSAATQVGGSKQGLTDAVGALQQIGSGQKQLIEGLNKLTDGSKQLQAGAGNLSQGLGDLQSGTAKLADASGQLHSGAQQVANGNRDLAAGEAKLADGSKQVADGNAELAGKLTDATKDSTVKNSDLKADIMSDPVHVNSAPIHPVATYGMGFASYFIPLSLWVGAVVLYFILSMREYRWLLAPVPSTAIVLGKFFTLGVVGIISAIVSGMVLTYGLGLTVLHPVQFYLIMFLLSWVSIAIIGFMIARFGSGAGRFLAILILILQLTSSAGTFPIEMVPGFFQAIHPYLPMSYGIEGLRAIISTGDQSLIYKDMLILGSILVSVLVLHILTTRRTLRVGDLHEKDVLQG
ncbi:YhgE/Pip domain-containing protein [Tumebacillus permanentifrigoris]|uniref:Putative membrane protein n=1 Tax=Tumebacillus permanentifrigoris TaxID=378543 RepID=A0A316DDU4_9BACL|nr:YhgE/Pip domain-containing protein [Tumebacillus permanentifrigoris]PWK13827.1 putative membrane protein [Tumebacillus permanentifrigoris]